MAKLRFDSIRIHRAGSTRRSIFTVAPLAASAIMLTILFLSYASTPPPRFVEAQSNVTEHSVTPSTFATYFDIDSTSNVATLKTSYQSNVTLVFGAGEYVNPIKIESASNVTLKASTNATTLNLPSQNSQASVIRTVSIIETSVANNHGSVLWIESSTNVTVQGFAFYFNSYVDQVPHGRFYAIAVRNSSGTTISDNVIEKVCDPAPAAGSTYAVGQCRTSGSASTLKWAIYAHPYTTFTPTTDDNDKVTNLVPISVLRNEINEPGIAGIQIKGFYDFTIADNVITGASQNWPNVYHWGTGISLQGESSGTVSGNTVSKSHEGGVNYVPQFGGSTNLTFRIVSTVTITDNTIFENGTAGIQIGGNRCHDAINGTEVDVVAEISGNHLYDNYRGVNVTSCYGTDEEEVTVDIKGNTFEHINTTPREGSSSVRIAPVNNSEAVGHFEVKIRFNSFKDSASRVLYDSGTRGATIDPSSVVDARYNYWDNDSAESPKDRYTAPNGTTQYRIDGSEAANVQYIPWLLNENLAGKDAQNLPSDSALPRLTDVQPVPAPESLLIDEGGTASFTVKLNGDPVNPASYEFKSDNQSLSFQPSSVTFDSNDWHTAKSITAIATSDANDSDEAAVIVIESLPYEQFYVRESGRVSAFIFDRVLARSVLVGRIVASTPSISVRSGDSVRLSVDIYGAQNILDNTIADNLTTLFWDDGSAGGKFDGDGRESLYTAPTTAGTYQITVRPPSPVCNEERLPAPGAGLKNCEAQFEIKVMRKTRTITATETPSNPDIDIPQIIVGQSGEQCEVFTPESGGRYNGDRFWIAAEPGVVPNGEIVGVCMSDAGSADNSGMTTQRYTLGGRTYRIDLVDVSGMPISSYKLNNPAEVCVPVPNSLRANISKLAIVTQNDDQSLSILASAVRIQDDGIYACGNLSALPADIAVGSSGSPEALPTATPEPATDELPDTGGYAPPINPATAILMLLLGMMTVSMFGFILTRRAKA